MWDRSETLSEEWARWLPIAAAVLIASGLILALWYAHRMAVPAQPEYTRVTLPDSGRSNLYTGPRAAAPTLTYSPPALASLPAPAVGSEPLLRPEQRERLIRPLKQLLAEARNSDIERFWQGRGMPERQVLNAVEGMAALTALTTQPDRFPAPLRPYVDGVSLQMRSYLKVSEAAAGRSEGERAALRTTAGSHLMGCEAALARLEEAAGVGNLPAPMPGW